MGFFDNSISSSIAQVQKQAISIDQFINNSPVDQLVGIGVAAAGNLTPAQIAAGFTGSPSQPSVVPSKVAPGAIANASPGGGAAPAAMGVGMLALIGAAVYFFVLRKKG